MPEAERPSKHVLVVNDTEEILDLFREIIEGMGHRVTARTFAPDDLAEIARIKPDLAVVDFVIGGETLGWQLIQKMKMSRETDRIPILICTGALKEVREQEGWLTSKGVKIVFKPFSIDDLEFAIGKALTLPPMLNQGD